MFHATWLSKVTVLTIFSGSGHPFSRDPTDPDDVVVENVCWELEQPLAKALKDASYKLLMGHDVYNGPEDHYFFDDFEEDFRQPYQERYAFSYFDDDTEENKEDEEKITMMRINIIKKKTSPAAKLVSLVKSSSVLLVLIFKIPASDTFFPLSSHLTHNK